MNKQSIIDRAEKMIDQLMDEGDENALYIQTEEKRKKYFDKVNYQVSIYEQLIDAVKNGQRTDYQLEEEEEPEQEIKEIKAPKKKTTISFREYMFIYGKEAARYKTISQARVDFNF